MKQDTETEMEMLPEIDEAEVGGELPPFLNLETLERLLDGKKRVSATIIKAPRRGEYGFLTDVRIAKEVHTLNLRMDDDKPSLNLARAIQGFGRDPQKWPGEKLVLSIGTVKGGKYRGKPFLQAEPAE